MSTKVYKMCDEYGTREQYQFLEFEDGQLFKMHDEYGTRKQYPFLVFEDGSFYKMRDEYGTREQYPFMMIEGFVSEAELFALLTHLFVL